MGKKGVLMDNGKKAQSSMALYWKKHHEQQKKPKKQYQKTQQQQLDQRVQTGFQKWKLHKEKMISKTYQKKQKTGVEVIENSQKLNMQNEQEEQIEEKQPQKNTIINIPGFKSKQGLKHKLRPEHLKEVDQSDNILKLPSHLTGITQEQIIKILRAKKAERQSTKRKNVEQKQEDVILGQDFLESFRKNPKQQQNNQVLNKIQDQVLVADKQQEKFFKSDILNQISKGDSSVILSNKDKGQIQIQQTLLIKKQQKEQIHQSHNKIKPLFKPRVLHNKKQ